MGLSVANIVWEHDIFLEHTKILHFDVFLQFLTPSINPAQLFMHEDSDTI